MRLKNREGIVLPPPGYVTPGSEWNGIDRSLLKDDFATLMGGSDPKRNALVSLEPTEIDGVFWLVDEETGSRIGPYPDGATAWKVFRDIRIYGDPK